ncbi:MAG TPA: RecQ family ATP-dependent DNA helicase [Fervidobacterium sp.]|nr:RecQ family ATP-dependent DNA helicase [Fervidobacterium sp.]
MIERVSEVATTYLKSMLGQDATFRDGQLEAISAAVNGQKSLIVQKTGWGKSIVYFIATKINRDNGKGITLLISPLLSLMRNQIENAKKIGVMAETINSENEDNWVEVKQKLRNGKCDILLVSPERLSNTDFITDTFREIRDGIGMFVVDEAHCISDWGHDFRPDYQRIVSIIKMLPPNIPIIATTATANDRVVNDIMRQLGDDIVVQRGSLVRESLQLQVIKLRDQAERLAWLDENLEKMPGSGIIYCLTVGDCEKVAKWLKYKGHDVEPYHAKLDSNRREELETRLINNEVKALVATVALGMGFDKPDIGFIIHYQRPGNIVSYYQQIGRAGRNIDNAYAILLCGEEDDEIQEYFISNAFPTELEMSEVLTTLENAGYGLSIYQIMNNVNMSKSRIEKALKFLTLHGAVAKNGSRYFRTTNEWKPDLVKSEEITRIRRNELERIKEYTETKECLMKFIAMELDDKDAKECGRCSNCLHRDLFRTNSNRDTVLEAISFLKEDFIRIHPRKQWPSNWGKDLKGKIPEQYQVNEGRALSVYGDSGWGRYVKGDKYERDHFREELVDASVDLIKKWGIVTKDTWITAVPSLRRPNLVRDFASRVATKLGVPFYPVIKKVKETPEQKTMQNTNKQAENVYDCFQIVERCPKGPVILIDDFVDSRWTFTMCGYKLRSSGSGVVYPFALATTSGGDGD